MAQVPLTYQPYRIPINSSTLTQTAEDVLQRMSDPEQLAEHVGWVEFPEVFRAGIEPQKDAKELLRLLKDSSKRAKIKEARIAKGRSSLKDKAKGLRAWAESALTDRKELALPTNFDVYNWLMQSPRYVLLGALHDSLVTLISTGEPKRIPISDVFEFDHPATIMAQEHDLDRAQRCVEALTAPITQVEPEWLIDEVAHFVVAYPRERSAAFYFGD